MDNLCHYGGTSWYGAGWGVLPCGVLSDTSARDLVDVGNSLPFEKSAVQLLKLNLQISSTATNSSWTSIENWCHPLSQFFTAYETLPHTFSSLTFTRL